MLRKLRIVNVGGACVVLSACGVTFADVALNQALPDDFKYRTVIKNSVDFRGDPGANIGLLISPDNTGQYQTIGRPLLAQGSIPQVATLKDGEVYSAKLDSGAAVQGNYLAFTAALSVDQTASLDIVDAVHAYVPPAQIPDDQIFAVAATASTSARYWIEDLYISTVTKTTSSKESASASASPPAYGAKGNVYAQDSVTSHDWVVAARLINVDAYAAAHGKPHNGPTPPAAASLLLAPTTPPAALSARLGQQRALAQISPRFGQTVTYSVLPPIVLRMP